MDGKKRASGGRNEEYPLEDIRANIQEGLKKVGVLSHPDSRYQGKEKHPLDPSSSTPLHLRWCQRRNQGRQARSLGSHLGGGWRRGARIRLPPLHHSVGSCCRQGFGSLSRQVLLRKRRVFLFHSGFLFVFKHREYFPVVVLMFALISSS